MADGVIFMSVREFRQQGYLQELNRLFLHPLGLAIDTVIDEEGVERLGDVWDCRWLSEGVHFDRKDLAPLARQVSELWDAREPERVAALGYMVQPESLERE